MSSSNQVGFQFQADVIGGASLVSLSARRLLKCLSDGGIDFYAVAASIELGSMIPISPHQQLVVSRLLSSRGGKYGFIAKALYIGWGHSDVAEELARTKAGSATLLLIDALVTGSTEFHAAVGLQELFLLYDYDPNVLPNVDALLTMIRYLAPFMQNSGFKGTFQQIQSCVRKKCVEIPDTEAIDALCALGDPHYWAKAVKQLAFTACNKERIYLLVRQRGSWLAALAAHLLKMEVQIRIRDRVVWETRGSEGFALFQLAATAEPPPEDMKLAVVDPPTNDSAYYSLSLDYPMGETLAEILDLDPRNTEQISSIVQLALVRSAYHMAERNYFEWGPSSIQRLQISHLQPQSLIERTCMQLGVHPRICQEVKSQYNGLRGITGHHVIRDPGLILLEDHRLSLLSAVCSRHDASSSISGPSRYVETNDPHCLCMRLGKVIHAFASTVIALTFCAYNLVELRLDGKLLAGEPPTPWMSALEEDVTQLMPRTSTEIISDMLHGPRLHTTKPSLDVAMLMDHLSHLLHGADVAVKGLMDHQQDGFNIHAISAGNITVYNKAILDHECFSIHGQIFEIVTGRLSLNKVLRSVVKEKAIFPGTEREILGSHPFRGSFFQVAPSLAVKPDPVEGAVYAILDTSLSEDAIDIICYVAALDDGKESRVVKNLSYCITCMVSCKKVDPTVTECQHDLKTPYKPNPILGIKSYAIASLYGCPNSEECSNRDMVILYSLAGRGVEQIIQASILPGQITVRAHSMCLSCIFQNLGGSFLARGLVNKQRYRFGFDFQEDKELLFSAEIKHIIITG